MAAETPDKPEYGFTIDGEIYVEPENLTIDDHRIIKRYTGYNFRDLAGMSPDAMYVDQDGIAAILHIAYRHVHPDLSFDEISEVIGRQNLEDAQATLQRDDGEVPLDPASMTKLDASSERSSTGKPKGSGTDSRKSSDRSAEKHATTETGGSSTSIPASDLETTEVLAS